MRILHVITGLGTGGAEVSLCRLIESLSTSNYEHFVVSLSGEGAMSERVGQNASELVHLGMRPGYPCLSAAVRLRKLIRKVEPDVIHGWMYHANLMATIAVGKTSYPLIWGVRQSLYDVKSEKIQTRIVIKIAAMLSGRANYIVYNAEKSAKQHGCIGFSKSAERIIPNGYDIEKFSVSRGSRMRIRNELGIPVDTFVIGHVARWHPVKDHETLCSSASLLLSKYPKTIFLLIGEGIEASNAQLGELLEKYGLRGNVILCGRRDDIAEVNSSFDIATSSSRYEAFPNTVAEAMACGVPCVATDVGDVKLIIGNSGFVVPAKDPKALCSAWEKVIELGYMQRRTLGEYARQRISERYSMAVCAEAYAKIYREVGTTR